MKNDNIYSDGTYIASNPSLHAEDSEFKMSYVAQLLEKVDWNRTRINILDIGGGAGILGKFVCEWFIKRGYTVSVHALDLSREMLEVQKKNNPYLEKISAGEITLLGEEFFDLILMIDVIEHIEDCHQFAADLNKYAHYIIYNIPIEINLMDVLRNIAMRNRHYQIQTESLGHIHFFSAKTATEFVDKHHKVVQKIFAGYAIYYLFSSYTNYVNQRKNLLRKIELVISAVIQKVIPFFAPYCIQGTLFFLARTK